MAKPKSAVTKATEKIVEEARLMDLRRQAQIDNQTKIIDRLLAGGGTYDVILQRLNAQVAELQVRLAEVEAENSLLRAEKRLD